MNIKTQRIRLFKAKIPKHKRGQDKGRHFSNKLTNQMQQFYKFITWRFVSLNMFQAPPRPSSGAYNCINL